MERLKISYKAARYNADLTLEQARVLIGVNRETLSNYENGITIPRADVLSKMAEVYGCSVADFKEVKKNAV